MQLQKMLDLCAEHADELDIVFNAKKSCLFTVGRGFKDIISPLSLGGGMVNWVMKFKYFLSSKSSKATLIDLSDVIRKFYAAANAIYSHTKKVHELSRLYLFESFTLPILTYGLDGLLLSHTCSNKLNVCWNNIYRKVFGMKPWESVKFLQLSCARLDLNHIIVMRNVKFLNGVLKSDQPAINICGRLMIRSRKFRQLLDSYEVQLYNNSLSCNVYNHFRCLCATNVSN